MELAFPLTIVNFSESGKTSSNYDVSSAGFSVEVILQGMFSRKKFEPKVVNGNVLRIVDEGTLDVDTYSVEIVVKEPNGTDVDSSSTYFNRGSRLAFRGNCVIVESSEEFKALTAIS